MAANRRQYSSKEDVRKEGDEGGGNDEGDGGGGSEGGGGGPLAESSGKDEVDYVLTSSKASSAPATSVRKGEVAPSSGGPAKDPTKAGVTLDKFNIFHLRRRPKSDPGTGPIGKHVASQQVASLANGGGGATAAAVGPDEVLKKKKSRFVKSASIARIFGNTYNTKKYDDSSALLKLQQFKRSFLNSEKFHKKDSGAGAGEDADAAGELQIGDSCYVNDSESSAKAIKSITRGLGRLLRRNCHSIDISRPDPEYKVSYLGNVLTGWAKGLWMALELKPFYRNNQNHKFPSTAVSYKRRGVHGEHASPSEAKRNDYDAFALRWLALECTPPPVAPARRRVSAQGCPSDPPAESAPLRQVSDAEQKVTRRSLAHVPLGLIFAVWLKYAA
uniref:Uncharacterized protein n=1 Tax=Anopheles atroparvus TaxID=41427 RepID=A0A182JJS8_ANOAO